MYRHLFIALCLASTAACAANTDDEAASESEDALRYSDVKTFQLSQSPGFVPPAPAGSCNPSGQWTVDMVSRKIEGRGCVNAVPSTVSRRLSGDEIGQLRTAIFNVKSSKRPEACPTDGPVTSLVVNRGSREDQYIVASASCRSSSIPLTKESLDALTDVVIQLAGGEDSTATAE
jgi:hypothetical protein